MVRRLFSAIALVVFGATAAIAQVGAGSLKGKVTDKKTGEPLPFVNVVVENKGSQVAGGATDFDGNYFIKPIDPGTYDVLVSYVGYQPLKIAGVVINNNKITFQDLELNSGIELTEFEVVQYNVPLIDKDGGASGGTVTREDIAKMPGRSAASIATTVAGASDAGTGGGISIRGARTENTYYYIDGVKVPAGAGTGLPKSAIEEVQVITGGVPANYGDVTGGVINITTRGPSRQFFGGLEYLTSGFKLGDDVTDIVGLDKFAYNQVEGSLSGPIFFRKDSVGNKTSSVLGFFLSGSYLNVQDDDPSYLGDYRVRKDARDQLLAEPLRLIPVGQDQAVVYSSDYLRADDIEHVDTRLNAARTAYLASGKLDIATTPTINLTVGGSFDYGDRQKYNRANSLLNSDNNTRRRDITWRGFVKFTQRFNSREGQSAEDNKSKIKNAYYTLQVDYSRYNQLIEDQVHGDNFFDYGYLGKFTTYRAPTYEFVDSLAAFVHTGFRDTLVTFVPSETNADVAAITTQYFGLFDYEPFNVAGLFGLPTEPGPYENLNEITRRNGLLNGERPRRLYDLWNNVGYIDDPDGGEYYKRQTDQFRLTAFGSADIGQHALSIGVEYEQLTDRRYELVPVGLWGRAYDLANFHLQELNNSSLDNATITYLGTTALYTFDRLVGPDQAFFDQQLRTSLGLDPNGTDIIDVYSLDPSQLDISMFSAEELINDGNSYVNFNGYDHLGNKVARSTFDDFFDEKDEFGNYTRIQPAFQPIYIAGYVMDKFAFDDIIFNLGVRVDRYDANQNTLKDKYLWRPAYTAGSSEVQVLLDQGRPGNIGDDYVVYVDRINDPTRVVGYRDGDTWYDATGQEITDPSVLRSSEGIAPYLIGYDEDQNGDLTGSKLKKSAFEDYTPAVNVMPRVAFSFPISDEALFFAHYDVLTQRPTSASRLDLPGYAYIQTTGNILGNPSLVPSKTIDYELGFQQVLSKSSSLKLSGFYRELRDMIAIRNVTEAWPQTYRTYDNIDFGTVKGITATYDLRRTGNVWMRASYTLQFADGTGSDPNTSLSLINANQPNLRTISPLNFDQRHRIQVTMDFRYGEGKDYNGPMLFGKPILQRTGMNVVAILGSGTPYSQSSTIYQEASIDSHNGNRRLDGGINGARLPWQFTTDMQIDRDITLHFGKDKEGSKAKSSNLNIYLLITNLFNTQNVTDVYRATGSPDNDGYLAAAQFQNDIQLQTDEASYRDLYALKVNNPGNYGQPRTLRLGLRLDF
ncbi:MAG: carboxypeptidase-like regulatory domain-containing protein [Flavobacteriales bacterium]|nr:carboxypeptidase-like regulatory domain-containing protein [Flavobacteriales bacterium]MCB9165905.1 carboxypeptidase-like regulatory domain-containing protein [Flavobacteriales bacterium]